MKLIKVIIADDHEVVIEGLEALLASEQDILVVGRATNGEHLLKLLRENRADVILMDIDMPGMDGIETTRLVKKSYPDIKVIMLTMHNKREYVSQSIRVGADGYLLKNTTKNSLIEGIRKAQKGGFFLPPNITPPASQHTEEHPQLTDREVQIICLIAQEYTSQEIGEKLFIAATTVEKHRRNIFSKLGVRNVAGLVRYAISNDLCDFD